MREIPLTKGFVALVDDSDYSRVASVKWRAFVCKSGIVYAVRTATRGGKRRQLSMHRVVVDAPEEFDVDHKDWNGLNNQRSNLRLCSHRQNMANARRRPGRSGFRGVQPIPSGRWRAVISEFDRLRHIGVFDSAEAAARAYDDAAINCYGEFAVLNFPREVIAK